MVLDKKVKLPMKIKIANSFFSRFAGLMFRSQIAENEGLLLVPCNSIHMFFMSFSIDAVFLDRQQRVVHLVEHLAPWKMVAPIRSAHATLELPAGSIRKFNLQIGSEIQFQTQQDNKKI